MTLQKNVVCLIYYRCRDIGYGVESGSLLGYWTGEIDTWGKYTVRRAGEWMPDDDSAFENGSGHTFYLFPDEVIEVEES